MIKICEVMQTKKSDSQILNIKCQYFSMFISLPISQTFLQKELSNILWINKYMYRVFTLSFYSVILLVIFLGLHFAQCYITGLKDFKWCDIN